MSTHQLSAPTSASSSANPSPAGSNSSIQLQALHHPDDMAHVEVPKGVENIPQGMSIMGGTALLAKKMAASGSSFYSPTDTLVSPCTQKLHMQKGKRWANAKTKTLAFGPSSLANSSTVASPPPSSAGFLHPAHAAAAAHKLALTDPQGLAQVQAQQQQLPEQQQQRTDANGDTDMDF